MFNNLTMGQNCSDCQDGKQHDAVHERVKTQTENSQLSDFSKDEGIPEEVAQVELRPV